MLIDNPTFPAGFTKVHNVWLAESTSVFSTATAVGYDNSVPQSSEGVEILTKTITPSSTGDYLKFTVSCWVDTNGAIGVVAAIFKDSEADATYSSSLIVPSQGFAQMMAFTFLIPVASTSAQTWKLRIGPGSGTVYVNQRYDGTYFGSSDKITMLIEEVTLT